MQLSSRDKDRFWSKVEKGHPCWEWQPRSRVDGYGRFSITIESKSILLLAHRTSYFLSYGVWPKYVLHTCDNRLCVNPAHLYAGTSSQNAYDRERRGRGRYQKGEASARARLTNEQVRSIRAMCRAGETHRAAALKFGVTEPTIWKIMNNRSYVDA